MHRLRNQVKKYKRWAKKPKPMATEVGMQVDEVATTSVAMQTEPIEYLFESLECSLSAEV